MSATHSPDATLRFTPSIAGEEAPLYEYSAPWVKNIGLCPTFLFHELYNRHRGRVPDPVSQFYYSRVSAVTVGITRRYIAEQ
jgi:hypothetical protein